MKKVCSLLIAILLIPLVEKIYAQAPTVLVPQIRLPQIPKTPTNQTINTYNPNISSNGFSQQVQQEALIREVQQRQTNSDSKAPIYIQNEIQRQTDIMMLTKYGFPSQSDNEGTIAFYSAFDEISNMLNGQGTLNLGRAVFLVENAWHNNKYDYNEYISGIKVLLLKRNLSKLQNEMY